MPCNDINNPSFESAFDFWYPGATPDYTTAWIGSGDGNAYSGNEFVTLATTPSHPQGTLNQDLYWLDDEVSYELTVQFRIVEPFGPIEGCTVSALLDDNEFASQFVSEVGDWQALTGVIQPPERNMTLSLKAVCGFSEESQDYQGQVLFDDVLFGPHCD
ncbi:hypothetical protein BDW74DRAFT_177993 [Aspergillus multicolor]|uniref:uncharacterized protein n=1 Tax=Aspergillus multicolor TaxID=41759 RepID=UPI003CCCAA84